MGFHLHVTLAALCVSFSIAFVAGQAASAGEIYWNSELSNATMPRAVTNVLPPGKGGDTVAELRHSSGGYKRRPNSEEDEAAAYDQRLIFYGRDQHTLETDKMGAAYDQRLIFYGRDHHTLETDKNEQLLDQRLIFYGRKQYSRSSDEDKVPVNPPSAPWFLEKDLYPGKQMEMEIARPENDGYTFVPRQVADSIPFSSEKFPVILKQLSIKPESPKAQLMKVTLKECELPAEKNEVRTCVTSLESMIDFSIQQLGNNIQAVSTEAEKDTKLQKFTILKGIKQIGHDKVVACHTQNYPYAVFYCHAVKGARAYLVPFVGTSGTKVMSVGVCHTNTADWRPEHESFKILKVKPGGEPVCHFLPEYNVLWTHK